MITARGTAELRRPPACPGPKHSAAARRYVGRTCSVLSIGIVMALGTAMPASAHNRALSTSPADGQVLAESPSTIDITVKGTLASAGAAISVTDPRGRPVGVGDPQVDHQHLRAALPALEAGAYVVTYRATTLDGHTVSASYSFVVDGSASRGPLLPVVLLGATGLAVSVVVIRRRREEVPVPSL
jgi:methionine-rich copper-binding protein CopC